MEKNVEKVQIENCRKCGALKTCNEYSTDGFDRMEDWVCLDANSKKIRGSVEWHEESKIPVPDWCPRNPVKKGEIIISINNLRRICSRAYLITNHNPDTLIDDFEKFFQNELTNLCKKSKK